MTTRVVCIFTSLMFCSSKKYFTLLLSLQVCCNLLNEVVNSKTVSPKQWSVFSTLISDSFSLDLCSASLAFTVSGWPRLAPLGSIEEHYSAGQQEILPFSSFHITHSKNLKKKNAEFLFMLFECKVSPGQWECGRTVRQETLTQQKTTTPLICICPDPEAAVVMII